ncbi:MAG: formylglycine-generating enzyme family protein [Treponema sp.]|nr:formylglycine-generating enzyme family protein [Treponema sp.]
MKKTLRWFGLGTDHKLSEKTLLFFIAIIIAIGSIACTGTHSTSIQMVWIPAGSFTMGSDDLDDFAAQPPHQVTLTQGFWMGKFPITQEQFQRVMGTNPSQFITARGSPPAFGETDARRPVETVSWYDAIVFANRLSVLDGLSPVYEMQDINGRWTTDTTQWGGVPAHRDPRWDLVRIRSRSRGYRLPTEAQWEFAARGGNGSPGNFTFSGSNNVNDVAWHWGNSGEQGTREVGRLTPNALGIHDMSGNVWEWVWDWFTAYTSEPSVDPSGMSAMGAHRSARGAAWSSHEDLLRSANRNSEEPYHRSPNLGFRLVRP